MPVVVIASHDLASRGNDVRKLLRLITPCPDGPAWAPKSSTSTFTIGTHDGAPPQSNPQDWRFATIVPNLRGSYHERWQRVDDSHWCLHVAYLDVFATDRGTREESKFLSLHCDPNEPDDAPHGVYKRGPHLHIQAAEPPFPHSHIALTCGARLELILGSVASVSEALEWAILMLRDEVLIPLQGE